MKLTKRKALQECIRIWSALARTGSGKKRDVMGADLYVNECPCCSFVTEKAGITSALSLPYFPSCFKLCPITWRLKGSCNAPKETYLLWCQARLIVDRKKYARQIVKLAKQALNKLPKKVSK